VPRQTKKTSPVTTYKAAMNLLFSTINYESAKRYRYNDKTFGLDKMRLLLDALGHPQTHFKIVHVAGTKGKGSTCTMLSDMLIASGSKVGLYTSPHVVDLRERIRVNSEMITEMQLVEVVNALAPVVGSMKENPPSFFEMLTAISFYFFAKEGVDVAVIETGLGGRLDSTNVVEPTVIGITSISIDHQRQLGATVQSIAMEKAGIFKQGVPIVSSKQTAEVIEVLTAEAERVDAPLAYTGKEINYSCRFESSRTLGPHNRICLTTPTSKFEHLPVPLYGEHQAENLGLALSLLDALKTTGFPIDDEQAITGLSNTRLSGRMEVVNSDPKVLIDGAHNAASIKKLIQATGQHLPYDSMVVIFGCCEDKDVDGMLYELQYGADKVIFTRVRSPRSVLPEDLAAKYTELCGKMFQVASDLTEAIALAEPAISDGDLILVTGSFYLVGEAKTMFAKDEDALLV
jgi:dihydrofolate synthase/folylpolyglutamate synthase